MAVDAITAMDLASPADAVAAVGVPAEPSVEMDKQPTIVGTITLEPMSIMVVEELKRLVGLPLPVTAAAGIPEQ